MAPKDLFDDGDAAPVTSSSHKGKQRATNGNDASFNINSTFASKYEEKKRGEELSKLKDKYGPDYDEEEDDSEDLSSDDSDAEFVTPEVDAAILKTLMKIRRADPSIYEPGKELFDEEEKNHSTNSRPTNKSAKPSKPILLRDYQRQALLASHPDAPAPPTQTPAQEAASLKAETKQAFFGADSASSDEDADDLLVPREKTIGEEEADEESYRKFLLENVGPDGISEALTGDKDESFLADYILNRGWLSKDAKKSHPKYSEIVDGGRKAPPMAPGGSGVNAMPLLDDGDEDLEEDAEMVEKAEAFESEYNFRYQDKFGATIVTHTRDAGASVRRKDETRKLTRDATKARKEEEKLQKLEELNRLKALKRKEVEAKIARMRREAGDVGLDAEEFDFESDFDPDEHDRRMQKAFSDGFYGREDADGKPQWDDDISLGEISDPDGAQMEAPLEMDADFEQAADGDKQVSKRQKQREKKKGKKKRQIEDALEGDVKVEGEEGEEMEGLTGEEKRKKVQEAVDEYYKMDYEDVIGDLPTRFKYTTVAPLSASGSQALTPSEILLATDAELNEVLGLRKIAPYRILTDKEGKAGGVKKKKLKELREKLKERKWGDVLEVDEEGMGVESEKAKGKGKKKSRGEKGDKRKRTDGDDGAKEGEQGPPKKRKGKKERMKEAKSEAAVVPVAE